MIHRKEKLNMKWKQLTGAFLAAALVLQSTVVFAGQEEHREDKAVVHTAKDGSVYFIEGNCSDGPVENIEDAARVVDSMTETLGGNEGMQFEPWRTLTDTVDNHYYVFQQMYADTTVSGGAIKVVTDRDNNMIGLISSIVTDLPDEQTAEGITANEAEKVVKQHAKDMGLGDPDILDGWTEKIVLPENRDMDPASEELEESRFAWVVYSTNPDANVAKGSDLPYMASYVAMDGAFLYSMPTVIPGDEAGTAGYSASYAFQFMEPAQYSRTIEMSDGTQKDITVTLMRDTRTGMYYLGNIERRIVVADWYEVLYNKGHVMMVASPDNTDWEDNDLLALYNYCRAWDYYNEIGWKGGDGLETPMIILKDFCDKDHMPIDNAAYAGHYYGWQVFLASAANDLSGSLDVLAHEFTHCVTGSVMTFNAYLNDYGAINEAMSDIQGNICQMMAGDTEDTEWNVAEGSQMGIIRSMSDPHSFNQPEYSWDLYYVPNVKEPTSINDLGGVHTNSSLLNSIAYRLCNDGGMTLEEARSFWFATDCTMVPGTDYAQLSELLGWVLKNQGLEKYEGALKDALDATKLGKTEMPSTLKEDQAMVTMKLPDNVKFNDGNWVLSVISVNPEKIEDRVMKILAGEGEYATAADEFMDIMMGGIEDTVSGIFSDETEAQPEELAEDARPTLLDWIGAYFGGIAWTGTGAAGEDGTTIHMVCEPGYTIPILMRMEMSSDSEIPVSVGGAVYVFGKWFDLGVIAQKMIQLSTLDMTQESAVQEFLESFEGDINFEDFGKILSLFDKPVFTEIKEGETCEISADGLNDVEIMDQELLDYLSSAVGSAMDPELDQELGQETDQVLDTETDQELDQETDQETDQELDQELVQAIVEAMEQANVEAETSADA